MSLLDDARDLATCDPSMAESGCFFCGGQREHTVDCLWRAMPSIVAALEAAERLRLAESAIKDRTRQAVWSGGPVTHHLGADDDPLYRELGAARDALYAALKGQE